MGSAIVYEFMNVNIMQSLTQTSLTIIDIYNLVYILVDKNCLKC